MFDEDKKEVSPIRRCAQIKNGLERAKCTHPEDARRFELYKDNGWIEWCTACYTVTDTYEG